jgi:hypothetical protein
MPLNLFNRNLSRAALVGAFGALVMFGAAPVQAAEAEDDGGLDLQIIKSVMTAVGLRAPDAPAIDYRERSPLVIPSNTNSLRPPVAASASKPANWPSDHDPRRGAVAVGDAAKKLRNTGDKTIDDSRVMSPAELDAPRQRQREIQAGSPDWNGRPMTPSELQSSGLHNQFGKVFSLSGNKDEVGKFTAEPPRTSLLAPPSGYQTPSPSQPYGVTKDRTQAKAIDYYGTHGTLEQK